MRASVSFSIPLVALTTSVPGATVSPTPRTMARVAWLGGAETITGAPSTASRASLKARSSAHSGTPGRNTGFSRSRLIASTTSVS